ncbi:MAG: hypothetical protein VX249_12470, partial [Pseudomonadota bacterium]|nr:hypothetical protein [Pseudomonadota bacterium]
MANSHAHSTQTTGRKQPGRRGDAMYDLLLKNARLLDPGSGHDATGDIAFAEGRVAALAQSIAESEAAEIRDVAGLIVTPGLIDLHTHVYWG